MLPTFPDELTMSDAASRRSRFWLFWPVLLLVLGFLVYARGLHGAYFLDDYLFYFDPPPATLGYFWTHGHATGFYRPLQATFLLLVQRQFGLETFPIHLIQLVMHVLLAMLVFYVMRWRGFATAVNAIASLWLLVTQAAACAVAGNDTFSQVACALFGWGSLFAWSKALEIRAKESASTGSFLPWYVGSTVLFGLTLLSKEAGVCFLLLAAVVGLWTFRQGSASWQRAAVQVGVTLVPWVLLLGVYFWARGHAGATSAGFGEGRYNFRIGPNIAVNVIQLGITAALPTSTANTFVAAGQRDFGTLALAGISLLTFLLLVVIGVWRARAGRTAFALLILATLALFPPLLLNKVSESTLR